MARAPALGKSNGPSDEIRSFYDRLIATSPGVERKGATMPYTSEGGNMFSFITAEGRLALRLPAADRQPFLMKYRTRIVVQHGAVMKEYVEVPAQLFPKTEELTPYFAASVAYVKTLPAKEEPQAVAAAAKEPEPAKAPAPKSAPKPAEPAKPAPAKAADEKPAKKAKDGKEPKADKKPAEAKAEKKPVEAKTQKKPAKAKSG